MSELVKIDTEITKAFEFNTQEVKAMVKKYQTLTLVPDDKDSYDLCQKALTSCVRTRTGINKRRLELNKEDQNRIKKRNAAAKQLEEIVAPAEDHLSNLINTEKARLQAIEDEKREAEKRMIDDRIKQLGQYRVILPYQDVAVMTDEEFDTALFDAKEEWEEQERKKAEAEAARKAENARLEKIREEQEQEAARLKKIRAEQEAEQAAREAEIKAKEDEIRKEQEAIQAEKDRIVKEKAQADERRWRDRLSFLYQAGWNGQEAFDKETDKPIISYDDMVNLSDADFYKIADPYNKMVEDRHIAKAEQDKADKEAREAKEAKEKAVRGAEEAKRQEALKSDKQKLTEWLQKWHFMPEHPELKNDESANLFENILIDMNTHFRFNLQRIEDL